MQDTYSKIQYIDSFYTVKISPKICILYYKWFHQYFTTAIKYAYVRIAVKNNFIFKR